ncbi:hypothetical protein glysoja_042454 [Glycine soja]|uniref:Protein EXORDIUM n=1 Tax=Glycine soja TaxID=3848 RepID=A0A0B2RD42_GLYSO|nr:hypothetical protein glysoja_042454 [Glycine soja]
MNQCGTHGRGKNGNSEKIAYAWVGNSVTQCPGQCAWPFHQPIYGPQNPPLVAPNNDVGLDGMLINVASLLAGTVTNPGAGECAAGGGVGVHRDFREGGVSRLRRGRSGGERDGGELQRGGDARPEVPSA